MSNGDDVRGTLSFIQHHVPVLDAGDYTLEGVLDLTVKGESPNNGTTTTRRFAVYGERFMLDPSRIGSVFPPPNATGEFANVLPHVVITQPTLPWERTPDEDDAPHEQGDIDVATWLALLVFDEAEAAQLRVPERATVADLLPRGQGGTMPTDSMSSLSVGALDSWEHLADPCQVIDAPAALFSAVAPSLNDLLWLAHARRLDVPALDGSGRDVVTDYAEVIASRLPASGRTSTIHLVSLEQLSSVLPSDDGAPSAALKAAYVRLVTFASWRVTATGGRFSFKELLEDLNHEHADDPLMRLPSGTATREAGDAVAKDALDRGFTALAHTTRDGDATISWYRGPLAPYALPLALTSADGDAPAALPARTADAVTAYDPATGMFDVSYGAAWQAGRLLGLADRAFATRIDAFKRDHRREVSKLVAGRFTRHGLVESVTRVLSDATPTPGPAHRRPAFDRAAHASALRDVLTDAERLGELVSDPPRLPDDVVGWLGRLLLLEGVPFDLLVPDDDLLPPESIRFFTVDPNWQAALLDGAFAIGRETRSDTETDRVLLAVAGGVLDQALHAAGIASPVVTGFLMRSTAVQGWWPGIRVDAFDANGKRLPVVRLDVLAPALMLCLVDGVMARVDMHEPPEGLHFGLDGPDDINDNTVYHRNLRYLGASTGHAPGELVANARLDVQTSATDATYIRPNRVVKAALLAAGIKQALVTAKVMAAGDLFTSAEFALEMVEGVDRVSFGPGARA
jgi:hypothetical protein